MVLFGVKFVVGSDRRMGNILDRNAHDSRNIVLYTNTLVPHKLKYFSGQNNSKYSLEVGSVITDDRNRNSTSGTFFQ